MKMADLPSRVVRPLGEWGEYQARANSNGLARLQSRNGDWKSVMRMVGANGLTPLQSRALELVGLGVNTVPEIALQTNASRDGVRRALLALKRRGLTDEVEPSACLPDRARQPSIWVAL